MKSICYPEMSSCPQLKSRKAITLLELLVVITTLVILIALLIPAVHRIREASRLLTCQNNLRQLGGAVLDFEGAHGKLPTGTSGYSELVDWNDFRNTLDGVFWKKRPHSSFLSFVLPFLDFGNLSNGVDPNFFLVGADLRADSGQWFGTLPGFDSIAIFKPPFSACPSGFVDTIDINFTAVSQPVLHLGKEKFSFIERIDVMLKVPVSGTSYLGCAGATSGSRGPASRRFAGVFASGNNTRLAQIKDGMSNTLLLGETLGEVRDYQCLAKQFWGTGGLARGSGVADFEQSLTDSTAVLGNGRLASLFGFGSLHSDATNFVFADGHILPIRRSINNSVFYRLCGMADGGNHNAH